MPESYTSTQQRLINVLKQRYATKNPEWDGQLDTVPASESTLYNMIWSQKNTLSWKADANGQLSLADNPLNQLNASGQKYVVTGGNFMSVVDQVRLSRPTKLKIAAGHRS